MRASIAMAVVWSAACSQDRTLVPPAFEDARSVLVLSPSQPIFAYAAEVPSAGPTTIELPDETSESPLLVSYFACTLADLGLTAGHVPLTTGDGRRFPLGSAAFRWSPEEDEAWTAVATTAVHTEIEPIRLNQPAPLPCNDFPVSRGPVSHLTVRSRSEALVVLESEVALLTGSETRYWVRPDLSIEPLIDDRLITSTVAVTLSSADEVLLVPNRGDMLSGHPDRGLQFFGPGPPNVGQTLSIARNPVGSNSLELFVFSETGLLRFDGSSWTILDATVRDTQQFIRQDALWISPGELVVLPTDAERNPRVLHWRAGAFTEIAMPDIPRSLGRLFERELLVGTENGRLLRVHLDLNDSTEVVLGWTRPMRPIWVIEPLEASLLVTGWSGAANEYLPERGFCSADGFTPSILGASISRLQPIGRNGELLGAGTSGFSDDTTRLILFRLGRSTTLPERCPTQ